MVGICVLYSSMNTTNKKDMEIVCINMRLALTFSTLTFLEGGVAIFLEDYLQSKRYRMQHSTVDP